MTDSNVSSAPSAPVAPPVATPPTAPKSNVLAIVAIALATVALVTAFIPGLTLITWLPGIAALVLGIIAVVKKQMPGLSITAIVVAPIAIIIAIIMGFVYAAAAISAGLSAAVGGTTSVVGPSDAATVGGAPAASQAGTRDNPLALGSAISNDQWTVVVNSYDPDGNATVAAGNEFNAPPPAGSHFEVVNYTVTYTGADSSYANFVQVDLVTTDGKVIDGTEAFVALKDQFTLDELYAGGSATGSKALLVPDGATGVLRITPGLAAQQAFVATK